MTEISTLRKIAAHFKSQLPKPGTTEKPHTYPSINDFVDKNMRKFERVDEPDAVSVFYNSKDIKQGELNRYNPRNCTAVDYRTKTKYSLCDNFEQEGRFRRITTPNYVLDDANWNGRFDIEDEVTFINEKGEEKTMDVGCFIEFYL